MSSVEDLFALLPRHVAARDAESSGGNGLLRALLEVVAEQLTALEGDVEGLYADFFVETARDWALPYLADVVGIDDLPPGRGQRAVVANTVDYRRHKGTVAAAEQVARDVAGSPSVAVEHHRLLTRSAHLNHPRDDRPAVASVRGMTELSWPAVAGGALDPLMHLPEVRRAAAGRGRYGIGNLWVHVLTTQVQDVPAAEAVVGADAWWVHPLGLPTPLFAAPEPEPTLRILAREEHLPVPLRPRRLLAALHTAREHPPLPLAPEGTASRDRLPVRISLIGLSDSEEILTLPPDQMLVCGLEHYSGPDDGAWRAVIDPVTGRIGLLRGTQPILPGTADAPRRVLVDHCIGARPGIGAGGYDRGQIHEDLLADETLFTAALTPPLAQIPVLPVSDHSLAAALSTADATWAGTLPETVAAQGTVVVSLGDSGICREDSAAAASGTGTTPPSWEVTVPEGCRLVLVAADYGSLRLPDGSLRPPQPGHYAPSGLRPIVPGDLRIRGEAGSALLIDGLTVTGDLIVEAHGLASVSVAQSTIAGAIRIIDPAPTPDPAPTADLPSNASSAIVQIVRSMVGAVVADPSLADVEILDTVLGPATPMTVSAPGAHLRVESSTIRGDTLVRTLEGTDLLADGTVIVRHRQVHCLRYSYVGSGSQTPRRFRPAEQTPSYRSVEPGDPDYLQLGGRPGTGLTAASETGNEVGVDARLRRTELFTAASRLVASYLPAGVELHLAPTRQNRRHPIPSTDLPDPEDP